MARAAADKARQDSDASRQRQQEVAAGRATMDAANKAKIDAASEQARERTDAAAAQAAAAKAKEAEAMEQMKRNQTESVAASTQAREAADGVAKGKQPPAVEAGIKTTGIKTRVHKVQGCGYKDGIKNKAEKAACEAAARAKAIAENEQATAGNP